MANDLISNSKAWFALTPEQQKLVTKQAFKEKYASGKNDLYNKANPATRAKIEQAHAQVIEEGAYNSEHNPSIQRAKANQEEADDSGWLANTFTKVIDSHKDLFNRTGVVTDAMIPDGTLSDGFARRASRHAELQREKAVTTEQKAVAQTLLDAEKKMAKDGFWSMTGLKAAAEAIPELLANPTGVIQLAADSASSMTSSALGAWGGSAAGSVVPVIGTVAGAAAGMFAAETADAASSKFLELASEKLKSQGLPPTEQNFQLLAQDKEFVKSAQITSEKYAATLAGTSTLAGFGLSRLATSPIRAVLKTARETVEATDQTVLATAAKAKNVSTEAFTDTLVNKHAATLLKTRSFKAKLGNVVTNYTGNVLSEPATEATAKAAIGEENTFTDLANETLGGIGTGPISVAVNNAAFGSKIIADKTVQMGKDIISSTPETRAASVTRADTLKQIDALAQTEAVHDYKGKIEAIDPEGEEYKNLSDPKHPTYNPIAAIDAVVKLNDPTAHTQAQKIASDYNNAVLDDMDRFDALGVKAKAEGKLSTEESAEAKHLVELIKKKTAIAGKLWKRVDTIQANVNSTIKSDPVAIDPEQDDTPTLMAKLGSHGSRNSKDTVTVDQLDALLKRPEIAMDSGIKQELETLKEAKITRQEIETRPIKSTDEVSLDIYNGSRGSYFKGIDAYQQGIQHFLNPKVNNPAKAQVELDGLKEFAKRHNEKASAVTELFDTLVSKKAMTPEQIKAAFTPEQQMTYESLIANKTIKYLHPVTSKNMVANIQQEAVALNREAQLAEMTYNRLSGQTNTTTSTPVQTAPVEAVVKPAVTPAAPTAPVVTPAPITKPVTKAPVVETPAATKPVVTSESVVDTPQTRTEKFKELTAEVANNATTPDGLKYMQDALVKAKAEGNPNVIAKIEKFTNTYAAAHNARSNSKFTWARRADNNYEVSTKGDKRFSALVAKLKDGRTIEEAYQLDVKGYRKNGNDWRLGKGKPPIRKLTKEQQWSEYKALWQMYLKENPALADELRNNAKGKTLTDIFASTDVSQARALAEILNETETAKPSPVSAPVTASRPKDIQAPIPEEVAAPKESAYAKTKNKVVKQINDILDKQEWPKALRDAVVVVYSQRRTLPKGAQLSVQSHLKKLGIEGLGVNWVLKNNSKVKTGDVKSKEQLIKMVETSLAAKQDKKQYKELQEEDYLEKNFDGWVSALNKYDVFFADMMFDYAIKLLVDKKRENKGVPVVNTALLADVYEYANKNLGKWDYSKEYDRKVIATATEAKEHERSASGKGEWIHVPHTPEPKKVITEVGKQRAERSELKRQLERENGDDPVGAKALREDNIKYASWETLSASQNPETPNSPYTIQMSEDKSTWILSTAPGTKSPLPDSTLTDAEVDSWMGWEDKVRLKKERVTKITDRLEVLNNALAGKDNVDKYPGNVFDESQNNIYQANIKLLEGLSPSRWCTRPADMGGGNAPHYVSSYDNYILVVDNKPVVGVEVSNGSHLNAVTSLANNGIASIDWLDDTTAFMDKHGIKYEGESTIAAAKKYREAGLTDADTARTNDYDDYDDDDEYRNGGYTEDELARLAYDFDEVDFGAPRNGNTLPYPTIFPDDWDDSIPFSKRTTGDIEGWATGDSAVVNAAAVSPENAVKVALHEVAHIGMIRLAKDLGGAQELHKILTSAKTELMKAVPELLKRTGHTNLTELAVDYGYDINTPEGEAKILVELTARWAEKFESVPAESWWTKLISDITAWYKNLTGKVLTVKEVDVLVAELIRYGSTDNKNTKALTSPSSGLNTKDIVTPVPDKIVAPVESQEAESDKPEPEASSVSKEKHERLTNLGIDPDVANQILNKPDISDKELTDIAKAIPSKIIASDSDIDGLIESVRTILKPETNEIAVDVLADYDINHAAKLKINFGTEDKPIMMTYDEAMTDNQKQLDEAKAVLDCVNKI